LKVLLISNELCNTIVRYLIKSALLSIILLLAVCVKTQLANKNMKSCNWPE